jgi:hypothetical protein
MAPERQVSSAGRQVWQAWQHDIAASIALPREWRWDGLGEHHHPHRKTLMRIEIVSGQNTPSRRSGNDHVVVKLRQRRHTQNPQRAAVRQIKDDVAPRDLGVLIDEVCNAANGGAQLRSKG